MFVSVFVGAWVLVPVLVGSWLAVAVFVLLGLLLGPRVGSVFVAA